MATDSGNIIVGAASLSIGGVDVGFTSGGVTLRRSNEFLDVEGDQNAGVIRKEPTMEKMFVNTTMLEATLVNLRKAMNDPTGNAPSGSSLDFGSASPSSTEAQLIITGKAPNAGTRTYTFYRAIAVEDVEHMAGARDQASVIPVGFELLKDENQNNKFGFVVDS